MITSGPVVMVEGQLSVIPPETNYDLVKVDLGVERPSPGVELLSGGASVSGSSVAVVWITGLAQLKIGDVSKPAIPLYGGESIVLEFGKLFLVNKAQSGRELVLFVGKK